MKNVELDIAGFLVSKKYAEMLTKTTCSSKFLFQICQPRVKKGRISL